MFRVVSREGSSDDLICTFKEIPWVVGVAVALAAWWRVGLGRRPP